MTTARDLIKSAFRLAKITAAGETQTGDELVDALKVLNDILEGWSTERLSVWQRLNEVFTLSDGVSSYTIGPGGTFNTTRPVRIQNSFITLLGTSFPLELWSRQEYNRVAVKQNGGIPERFVYINEYPLGTLIFYPTPTDSMSVSLSTDKLLSFPLTLTTVLAYPPGYERALRFALAINLADEYGVQVSAATNDIAIRSKADIKRANRVPVVSQFDPILRGPLFGISGESIAYGSASGGGDGVDVNGNVDIT